MRPCGELVAKGQPADASGGLWLERYAIVSAGLGGSRSGSFWKGEILPCAMHVNWRYNGRRVERSAEDADAPAAIVVCGCGRLSEPSEKRKVADEHEMSPLLWRELGLSFPILAYSNVKVSESIGSHLGLCRPITETQEPLLLATDCHTNSRNTGSLLPKNTKPKIAMFLTPRPFYPETQTCTITSSPHKPQISVRSPDDSSISFNLLRRFRRFRKEASSCAHTNVAKVQHRQLNPRNIRKKFPHAATTTMWSEAFSSLVERAEGCVWWDAVMSALWFQLSKAVGLWETKVPREYLAEITNPSPRHFREGGCDCAFERTELGWREADRVSSTGKRDEIITQRTSHLPQVSCFQGVVFAVHVWL
ncbi:hypothetical protein BJ508DRAFT_305575 [Ascobolus immersus RN42]|uniref:Uncharacterized protein n=1 Tax=Ascobolus immersus RN42 TaxID=1160509 RepID=A0A3N4IAD8_ASCIM|nr:hypothetical protein BJ508DRAFT_305575 [Ascobolus immersus RN42]